MEPLFILVKILVGASISALPVSPSTVAGEVEISYVANVAALEPEIVESVVIEAEDSEDQKEEKPVVEEPISVREGLALPLKPGVYSFTDNFGPRCAPVPGASNNHLGIDLAAPKGTPLYAIASGTITKVVDGVNKGIGGSVVLRTVINGETVDFHYHHMENSSQYVKEGQQVQAGQHITNVASTGVSSGPHLHLEVWKNGYRTGTAVDPEKYFKDIGLEVIENAASNTVTENPNCSKHNDKVVPEVQQVPTQPSTPPSNPQQPTPSTPPPSEKPEPTPQPTEPPKTTPAPPTPKPTPTTPPSSPPTPKPETPTTPAPKPTATTPQVAPTQAPTPQTTSAPAE